MLPAPTAPSEGSAGVRSTWSPLPESFGSPLLDPGSPAQASLLTEQLPLARSPINLLDCAARRFAGRSIFPARRLEPKFLEAKTTRCSAALLGETALASRFAHHGSEEPGSRVAREAIPSSGASSRLARKEPKLFPFLPAEIGPLVTCRTRLPFPAPGEAGTAVPITQAPCTSRPSRGSEKFAFKPVENGDIGHNRRNLPNSPNRSRLGCRSVLLRLLAPSA